MPVLGRGGRRAVRRHAVCGSADAVPAPASAQRLPAAQVQDRLRGLHARSHRGGDQRHRLDRARANGGRPFGARLPGHGCRRHGDADAIGQRALRVRAGRRDVQHRRGHRPRVPPARRLQAQAAEPPEVPGPLARLGRVQGGVRQGARGVPAGGRRAPAVRARESAGGRSAGGARQRARGGRHRRGGHERKGHRARDRSARRARPTRRERTR